MTAETLLKETVRSTRRVEAGEVKRISQIKSTYSIAAATCAPVLISLMLVWGIKAAEHFEHPNGESHARNNCEGSRRRWQNATAL
jgi:hypothetical protein